MSKLNEEALEPATAFPSRPQEAELRAALAWYSERAMAAEKYMAREDRDEALLAVITELALDGGKRARALLSQEQKP